MTGGSISAQRQRCTPLSSAFLTRVRAFPNSPIYGLKKATPGRDIARTMAGWVMSQWNGRR